MDDDELNSDAESFNGESDGDFRMNTEGENNSASFNIVEDSNSTDNDIDPAVLVRAFKHLKGFAKSFKKKRKQPHSGVQKRSPKFQSTSGTARSRCNNKYFGEIIRGLDEHKKKIITDLGFGILLQYDGCPVPRVFVQWLADHVDVNCYDIVVGGKTIPFSPVKMFLGLPLSGEDIKEKQDDSLKSKFLKKIDQTSMPLIRTFGSALLGNTLSDDNVFRYFMVVALSTFLCLNSNTLPSPKYLGPLIDVSTAKDWNWSKFIFEWLLSSISSYRNKKRNTIGGCIYFFAAYYLDFLNFGTHNHIPQTLPRILCWKGSMIKKYSSYDCVSANKYGKRPVKSIDETCYAKSLLPFDASASFRDSLLNLNYFTEQARDELCDVFQQHHTTHGFRSPGELIISMFKVLQSRYGRVSDNSMSESSDGRMPNVEEDGTMPDARMSKAKEDGLPMADEFEAPVPASRSHSPVEEVDPVMPTATVDPVIPTATVENTVPDGTGNNEDVSVTEKIDSHGTFNGIASESCGVSQPTKILASKDSTFEAVDSSRSKRKWKNGGTQSSSPDSVSSRTRHGLSKLLAKSPLSRRKDDSAEISALGNARSQGTKGNPLVVEDDPILSSKGASKR